MLSWMQKHFYFKQFSLAKVHRLNLKTALFQVILFGISTQFSSIWLKNWTLSRATTPGYNESGVDGNKRIVRIPQRFSITGASPSGYLVLYPEYSLAGVLPLSRDAVGVFYGPNRLGQTVKVKGFLYDVHLVNI